MYWYARQLRLPVGVPAHLSGTLASMGCSVPYGIAAKLLHPDRPLVALSGDGAMQMAGLAELITVARMWPHWSDPRFVVCVFHNADLAEVSWEQREMEGEPLFPDSQDLPAFPYDDSARLLGLHGHPGRRPGPARGGLGPRRSQCPADGHRGDDRPVGTVAGPVPGGAAKLDQMRQGHRRRGQSRRAGAQTTRSVRRAGIGNAGARTVTAPSPA